MKICIVCYGYALPIGSLTSDLPRLLREAGHDVVIYSDSGAFGHCEADPQAFAVPVRIYPKRKRRSVIAAVLRRLTRFDVLFSRLPLFLQLYVYSTYIFGFSMWVSKEITNEKFDVVIPIEATSLATLWWCKLPIFYLNLELLSWDMDTVSFPHKFLLKSLEVQILNRVKRVYITSPLRGDIFAEMNRYPRQNVKVLPVVPAGREQVTGGRYFHEKFNLSHDTKIVLYAGHILHWSQMHIVITTMQHWPANTALVLHTWRKDITPQEYLDELLRLSEGLPVFFSFENIPKNLTCQTWASADIGIAFYETLDDNFTEILFSSNKMGEYLKAGLPIITSNFPSLVDFVGKTAIGQAVAPSECAEAVCSILNKYDYYTENVQKCHKKYFVLETYVNDMLEDLHTVVREAST